MPGYDYTLPGAYFVTICVRDGECLLGAVVDEAMQLGAFGQIAHEFWAQVVVHFPGTALDVFTTMPNHVHAVIVIQEPSLAVGPEEESEETSPLRLDHPVKPYDDTLDTPKTPSGDSVSCTSVRSNLSKRTKV